MMESARSGRFITFEGIEGAGKSTQIQAVSAFLAEPGRELLQTREPGGTPLGERVRAVFLDPSLAALSVETELLLLYAARAQHLEECIRPCLARGAWVLCDRFEDSTFAYQGGGRGLPASRIEALSEWTLQGMRPDLTFWLDVDPALGLARAGRRSAQDRLEQESVAFFTRARAVFEARWRAEPERIMRIDANENAECVGAAIRQALEARRLT